MKNKSILITIILLLICFIPTINAADTGAYGKKASLTGNVVFAGETTIETGSKAGSYHYYDYQFNSSDGGTYSAYCISPAYSGSKKYNLSCTPMSSSQFPATYSLLASGKTNGVSALTRNIAFRAAGLIDSQKGGGKVGSNDQFKAFNVSIDLTSGTPVSASDQAYSMLGNAEVKAGFELAVEASRSTPTASSEAAVSGAVITVGESGGTGTLVKVTPMTTGNTTGVIARQYKVESITGSKINDLYAVGDDKLSAKLSGWDGLVGTLTVTPKNTNDCDGIVTLTGASASTPGADSTVYLCGDGKALHQSFTVLGPGLAGDKFQFTDLCECNESHPDWNPITRTCERGECRSCDGVAVTPTSTPVEIDIENCCGGHNKLSQEYLNKLFCKDETLQVDNYKSKCGAASYEEQAKAAAVLDGDELCEIWCADSLEYGLPEPSEGMVGRGFELKLITLDPAFEGDGVTKSEINGPWLKEWARCRVTIDFKKFETVVKGIIADEKTNYNRAEQNSSTYNYLKKVVETTGDSKAPYDWWYTVKGSKEASFTNFYYIDGNGNRITDDDGNYIMCTDCTTTEKRTAETGTYRGTFNGIKFYNTTDTAQTVKGVTIGATNRNDFRYMKVKNDVNGYTSNEVNNDTYGYPDYEKKVIFDPSDVSSYRSAPNSDFDSNRSSIVDWLNDSIGYDWDCKLPDFEHEDWMTEFETAHEMSSGFAGFKSGECTKDVGSLDYDPDIHYEKDPGSFYTRNIQGDISSEYGSYRSNASQFNANVDDINDWEKNLTKCDNAMRKAEETDASNNAITGIYTNITKTLELGGKIELPELTFTYVQAFLGDDGVFQKQELSDMNYQRYCTTKWETKGVSSHGDANGKGIDGDKYSSIYGSDKLKEKTIKNKLNTSAELRNDTYGESQTYNADKVFVNDGLAEIYCIWDNQESDTRYTLVPSGILVGTEGYEFVDPDSTVSIKLDANTKYKVEHNKWRYVYNASLYGTFETYFTFSRIGIFNDYTDIIKSQTTSCSGENLGPSCTFTYNRDFKDQGGCIDTISKTTDICDPNICPDVKEDCTGEAKQYFDYKVADPTNLFPNDYSDDYAYNWQYTEQGKETKEQVEKDGNDDKTYSPDNLTYSFSFSTGDLKAIRDYNKAELEKGGYMDFEMTCKPNRDVIEDGYYVRCESDFLNAISGGRISYGAGKSKELSLNAGTSSMLSTARGKVKWED